MDTPEPGIRPGSPALQVDSLPTELEGHFFLVLALEGLVGHHRIIQLQLLQHYWLGHRLGLL